MLRLFAQYLGRSSLLTPFRSVCPSSHHGLSFYRRSLSQTTAASSSVIVWLRNTHSPLLSQLQRRVRSTLRTLKEPLQWSPEPFIYGIIAVNTAIYLQWQLAQFRYQNGDGDLLKYMTENFTFSRSIATKDWRWWTLFTSMFSQATTSHFAFNMLVLYGFGPAMASMLGIPAFVRIYLLSGLSCHAATSLYYEWLRPRLMAPQRRFYQQESMPRSLGASGCLMGLMSVYALAFPTSQIYLFFVIPVPALACLLGISAYDLYKENVGHLGGAAAGAAYYFLKTRRYIRRF